MSTEAHHATATLRRRTDHATSLHPRHLIAIGALIGLLAAPPLPAQQPDQPQAPGGAATDSAHAASAPAAQAVRIGGGIRIDGRLDEATWASVPPITRFTQVTPDEGQPSTERTEVRIAYDVDAIYVGAYLHDRGRVMTRLLRRDALAQDSDWLEVSFDAYHDHQTASTFAVNPAGVRRDQTGVDAPEGGGGRGGGRGGPPSSGGSEWNPVWEVATAVTDSGWMAEMRIPLSQLRFGRAEVQTWGLQVRRTIARRAEEAMFAFVPRNERGGPARFGHLQGLERLEARDPLEIIPYVSGRADFRRAPRNLAVDFDNPFRSGRDLEAGIGADLQYRLSSNFTLNAAVNPDFGQVEVDPAVINLTDLEIRLQENRPLFVEGADIFRFGESTALGSAQLLYTRRVGRAPSLGAPPEAAYVDMPASAGILGAAKLTGRTSGGWSLGFLDAVTRRERAPWVDAQNVERAVLVEPLSNYFATRVRRDLNSGGTSFGAVATAVNRRLEGEMQEARLRAAAYAGGIDFRHEWASRRWSATGHFSPSYIRGSEAAMIAAQNSSARYFGRPDADHLSVDSAATSLAGYAANVNVGRRAGAFVGSVELGATSPTYEINDLGFQTTADRLALDLRLGYRRNRPGRVLRSWAVLSGTNPNWNYGGERVSQGAALILNGQLLNYWSGGLILRRQFSTLNDRLTRGGPLARTPAGPGVIFNFSSDFRKPYTIGGNASLFREEGGASATSAAFDIGLRPAGNWDVRVGPSLLRTRRTPQYVQPVTDATAARTFGRRYVFAELDQTVLSLETRLNVNFTPDLSFELYAQPLIASGDYGTLMELERPRTFDFVRYGIEGGSTISAPDGQGRFTIDPDGPGPAPSFRVFDRDFSTRSLRGNAVLRWEWRPGSTLFVVWQQSRAETLTALDPDSAFRQAGSFDPGRDARELFGLRPDNVFMVKMTWWINP